MADKNALNKTKVDDLLIEMITPKVREIEEKFSNNQPLSQDDINTLLLKAQYNHINHLDEKLNEVTSNVASLKIEFKSLEGKFSNLENRVEQRFETFEQRFETFENKMEATIQKALNKNIMLLIAALGFFMTLSKIIDKF